IRDYKVTGVQTCALPIYVQVAGKGNVPATGASAAVLNVTATNPTSVGHLTVFPAGTQVPGASSLNFKAGQTVPNRVIAMLGSGEIGRASCRERVEKRVGG